MYETLTYQTFQDGAGSKKEKEKERLKVCKPPPETKRPPRLMQTRLPPTAAAALNQEETTWGDSARTAAMSGDRARDFG